MPFLFSHVTKKNNENFDLKLKAGGVILNGKGLIFDDDLINVNTIVPGSNYELVDAKRSASLTMNEANKTGLFKVKDKKVLISEIKENVLTKSEEIEYLKLVILYYELFNKTLERKTSTEWRQNAREAYAKQTGDMSTMAEEECNRYNINGGWTYSQTKYDAERDAESFLAHAGSCKLIGIDVTCALDVGPCVGTGSFKCTGSVCDENIIWE